MQRRIHFIFDAALHGLSLKISLTCLVTNALTSGSKVKGLSDCELWLMQVVLVNVGSGVCSTELIKASSIVCDAACHL